MVYAKIKHLALVRFVCFLTSENLSARLNSTESLEKESAACKTMNLCKLPEKNAKPYLYTSPNSSSAKLTELDVACPQFLNSVLNSSTSLLNQPWIKYKKIKQDWSMNNNIMFVSITLKASTSKDKWKVGCRKSHNILKKR